jgi:hypothetical protein
MDRMVTDQRRKLACFYPGAQAREFFSQGRKLAWTMQHSHGSEAQARMLLNSRRKLACFSQGRKLAWTMQHSHG